jgi:large subunit ribosomal protein L47
MPPRLPPSLLPSTTGSSRSSCEASLPKIRSISHPNARQFSLSSASCYPRTPRGNRLRGMSAIRGTGVAPWIRLSVSEKDVREPRVIRPAPKPNTEHGLWGFFNEDKALLTTPYEESKHGTLTRVGFLSLHPFNSESPRSRMDRGRASSEVLE